MSDPSDIRYVTNGPATSEVMSERERTQYDRLWAARELVSTRRGTYSVDTVNELMAQAISYVWGWQDAGGDPRDSDAATEFGYAFGTVVALCELAKCSRPPIHDAWKSWREFGEIRDYNGRALNLIDPA